ncbi:MAG: GtrA family protein [Nanoarchaeota archaeon]|nr:GtrA family protein [Nanoarchaeota archaeon]
MNKETKKEIFYFGTIGAIAAILNVILLYFFTSILNFYYIHSAVFSFVFASTVSFLLNKKYTFKEKISYNLVARITKFFSVNSATLLLNLFLLYYLTEYLQVYYITSQLVTLALISSLNYFGNKHWTFKNQLPIQITF